MRLRITSEIASWLSASADLAGGLGEGEVEGFGEGPVGGLDVCVDGCGVAD